jgi:hypothetical protein
MQKDHQSTSGSTLTSGTELPPAPLSPQPLGKSDESGIKPQLMMERDAQKEPEIRLKFAEETHQYVREYIRLADQKATFFFAGSTALLAYLHKVGLTNVWQNSPVSWKLFNMLAFLATTSLFLCTVACLATVMPRLKGTKRGIIFFSAIFEYETSSEYASDVMKKSPSDLCEAKLKHTHDLSSVCKKKYDTLRLGQWLGAVAVISSLLLLVLQK